MGGMDPLIASKIPYNLLFVQIPGIDISHEIDNFPYTTYYDVKDTT